MAYRIANWNDHYESANSRRIKGHLPWIPLPTKTDGKRYRRLMKYPNGSLYFAAFVALLQIAAKAPKRGLLIDEKGEDLDCDDFEDVSFIPHSVFREAIPILSSKRIGWIEEIEADGTFQPEQIAESLYADEQKPEPKPEPAKKSSKKKAKTNRKPDLLFDAVAECHGIKPGNGIDARTAKQISPIAAQLRTLNADPGDVLWRWRWIVSEYPGATINALPKQWQAAGRGIETGRSAKPGSRKPEPNARPEDTKVPKW